jgi:hypothetical protein
MCVTRATPTNIPRCRSMTQLLNMAFGTTALSHSICYIVPEVFTNMIQPVCYSVFAKQTVLDYILTDFAAEGFLVVSPDVPLSLSSRLTTAMGAFLRLWDILDNRWKDGGHLLPDGNF